LLMDIANMLYFIIKLRKASIELTDVDAIMAYFQIPQTTENRDEEGKDGLAHALADAVLDLSVREVLNMSKIVRDLRKDLLRVGICVR
jgi:hypothetical protein